MAMAAYAARRTLFYVIVFFVVSFLVFTLIYNGYYIYISPPLNIPGFTQLTDSRVHDYASDPFIISYFKMLGDFFTGDWGTPLVLR